MATTYSCSACEELRQEVPELICNGFDDEMCSSLSNDSGLSPTSGHNDCTDLNNLNDCLVGNEEKEVDLYEVCDWKTFMKQFIGNLWVFNKSVICAICGIWANIHNLWNKIAEILQQIADIISNISALCDLINQAIAPSAPVYGIFPRTPDASQQARTCGFIPTNNGRPALIDAGRSTAGGSHHGEYYTGVGIYWGTVNALNCSTHTPYQRNFWKPYVWGMELNKDVSRGDALWVISKAQLQQMTTWSDALWQAYTDESWTWSEDRIVTGSDRGKNVWLKLHVGDAGYSNDYLVLTYDGTSYPNAVPDYDAEIRTGGTDDVRWG